MDFKALLFDRWDKSAFRGNLFVFIYIRISFFFRFIPLYANMSRYFYIMGTYIKFAILLIAKLNE